MHVITKFLMKKFERLSLWRTSPTNVTWGTTYIQHRIPWPCNLAGFNFGDIMRINSFILLYLKRLKKTHHYNPKPPLWLYVHFSYSLYPEKRIASTKNVIYNNTRIKTLLTRYHQRHLLEHCNATSCFTLFRLTLLSSSNVHTLRMW